MSSSNDNSPDPLPHTLTRAYRARATHLLEASGQLSSAFLTNVNFLHSAGAMTDADVVDAWAEFIAANMAAPANVVYACTSDHAPTTVQTALDVLHTHLAQACKDRGLVLNWQVTVSPALIVPS